MYGSDAGQPVPSLYTKRLSPLCDTTQWGECERVLCICGLLLLSLSYPPCSIPYSTLLNVCFPFLRCFIHSRLGLSQALRLLRHSSLSSLPLDVLVYMCMAAMHTLIVNLHALMYSKHQCACTSMLGTEFKTTYRRT